MKKENSIVLFNQIKVRRHWDEDQELWYFSIVDVVAILTDSVNPQAYWRKLKERLKKEGIYELAKKGATLELQEELPFNAISAELRVMR